MNTHDTSPIFLLRHCSALGQEPEAALSPVGESQAQQLVDLLNPLPIQHIISSPYRRALGTIGPFASGRGLSIREDPRLSERRLGTLPQEKDWRRALEETFLDPFLEFPDGESSSTAQMRALAAVSHWTQSCDGPVLFVTHGNLLTLLVSSIDRSLGFKFWSELTSPDLFLITSKPEGSTWERLPLSK